MLVYHFTKAPYALENIEKRRLKIARYHALNDPFEFASPAFVLEADRKSWQATKLEMDRRSGILCFSENWTNPVQWSHYADHHKGVCLGFEVRPQLLRKVLYFEERQRIEDLSRFMADGRMTHDWMEGVICTKFSHWAYEQEHRAFVALDPTDHENGLHFQKFNDDLTLAEVIVGPLSTVTRAQLDKALGDLKFPVRTLKARLAFQTFNVCEQRDATLWI